MTVQPTRDQLLDMTENLRVLGDRPELCDEVVDGLWAALAQAEHRIARLEAQTSIRGRAVVMYRERAREAEAQVEAWRKQYEYDTARLWDDLDDADDDLCEAEAERDEWRQTALDERAAALDLLEQIKVRDARIKAVQDALDEIDSDQHAEWAYDGVRGTADEIRRALEGDA